MKLVLVHWLDSRGATASWEHLEVLKEHDLCEVESVGWLLQDTKELIQLVPHLGTDPDQGCGDMTIPKFAIIKMKVLKP